MIAKEVIKESGGLPLAIVTVGLALRHAADISEWECALDELRASTANIERMEEAEFEHLRFSYAKLKDDTSRSCFLFCALYPESHQIYTNELMEYWMWEGLLGYVGGIAAIKRKGKIILNELKHACLLEGLIQTSVEFVRMHLIRDMAITIMRKNPHCICKAGTRMTKHQWIEEGEDVQRVSLMRNDLQCIPFIYSNLMCPRLISLLLQFNSFSENISDEFFKNMRFLKVLNLSYTGIDFLPNSVSNLENLPALLLSNCWNLSAVPSLEKLNKLMVLDLSCSPRMKELPNGMQNLGNLRRLNLSKTGIEIFPFGLISKFPLLEDLLIGGCGILWGSMTVEAISGGASIEEVIISSNISSLELDLWNADVFDQYAKSGHWVQLDKFRITIGQPQAQFYEDRGLPFSGRFVLRGNPVSLPPNTLELHLDGCADIKNLSMCLVNVTQLKYCKIWWCDDIECIIDSEEEENALPMLERMKLLVLGNLKIICRDVVGPGTLTSLKIITEEYCPKQKTLFSGQILLQLKNLEEISVRSFTGMEYIMKEEEKDFMGDKGSGIEFSKLKRMKLKFMPLLESIYDGTILCPCLRSLDVASCEALKRLPLDLSTTPALEEIKATKTWGTH